MGTWGDMGTRGMWEDMETLGIIRTLGHNDTAHGDTGSWGVRMWGLWDVGTTLTCRVEPTDEAAEDKSHQEEPRDVLQVRPLSAFGDKDSLKHGVTTLGGVSNPGAAVPNPNPCISRCPKPQP